MDSLKDRQLRLNNSQLVSLLYHSIFKFPLTLQELDTWRGLANVAIKRRPKVLQLGKYYCLAKDMQYVDLRERNLSYSLEKIAIAKKACEILKFIPWIKMVAITGSVAMLNAKKRSDVDLMVITSLGRLWTTRIVTLIMLKVFGVSVRRAGQKNERDKICLNLWLDESGLKISKRDIYTAHEVLQIVPLINKDKIYERFISINSWAQFYWPGVIKNKNGPKRHKPTKSVKSSSLIFNLIEKLAFIIQLSYMKPKLSKEKVMSSQAFFHPFNWGDRVTKRMAIYIKDSAI